MMDPWIESLKKQYTDNPRNFYFEIDGQPDIKINGWVVNSIQSTNIYYLEHLAVYLSDKGNVICIKEIKHKQSMGEKNSTTAAICNSTDLVYNFFGYSKAAKTLYAKINLDFYVEV